MTRRSRGGGGGGGGGASSSAAAAAASSSSALLRLALDAKTRDLTIDGVALFRGVSRALVATPFAHARSAPSPAHPDGRAVAAMTLSFESPDGTPRSRHAHALARSIADGVRFVACSRCKLWWMSPAWGAAARDVPSETQFMLFELEGGRGYVALVPTIAEGGFRSTLTGHRADAAIARATARPREDADEDADDDDAALDSTLSLVTESNCAECATASVKHALAMTACACPFRAVEAAMAMARDVMSSSFRLRREKTTPPTTDVFGWCTWDAFYHQVTPAGIEEGVGSLRDGGTPPRFVIIDDGWQSVQARSISHWFPYDRVGVVNADP
jgi:raffinose synthase